MKANEIIKKLEFLVNHKTTQRIFLSYLLFASAVLIGIADIIQNFGTRYNPPDFWLGIIYKIVLFPIFVFCLLYLTKDYKPFIFNLKLKEK